MASTQKSYTNGTAKPSKPMLWTHPDPDSTQMADFMSLVNAKYMLNMRTYEELYQWSIENTVDFWGEVWKFTAINAKQPYNEVMPKDAAIFPRPDFFAGARLNFAENLLYPTSKTKLDIDANAPAIIEATESGQCSITWAQLRERVRRCALALRSQGVVESDRVAGFLGNHANAVIAMLATASIGAIWTGVSPDTGVTAVLERLVQIEPKILFVDNAVGYNGKVHGSFAKVKEILAGLTGLAACVMFETVKGFGMNTDELSIPGGKVWKYEDFADKTSAPLEFNHLPPSHPLYILYSSGTTGAPKCIVHSSLGTLIQHKKEHILHCDLRPGDRMLYFTTTTWMMWHWLVSALASGATIILYDGSPFHPHGDLSMPRLIQDLKITHFGTSAKYLSILEQKGIKPMEGASRLDLSSLKAIYSTGSPLAPSTFNYVYQAFPSSINLGSITGGTDIVSLFGAPCPLLPVYSGEIQCAGLGMAVEAWSPSGEAVPDGEEGDLVCTRPFPCQPVTFFHTSSPSQGQAKYREAYFEQFPGVWHHGDFIRFEKGTRGLTMLGRSDGILKPSGVRFGSAEIYNVLLKHFSKDIADAICVGRRRETDTDEVVVLFLKMADGQVCDTKLKDAIKAIIRKELSARHVPAIIDECFDIPITGNGKKVEIAVKQILCGMNIKVGASVANKECLEWYQEWATSH